MGHHTHSVHRLCRHVDWTELSMLINQSINQSIFRVAGTHTSSEVEDRSLCRDGMSATGVNCRRY